MMVRLRSLFVAIVLVIGASSCEKIIKGMIPEPMISMKIDGKNVQKGENDNYYFKSELVKNDSAFGFYLRSGSLTAGDSFRIVMSYASDMPFELNKTYNFPSRSENLDWDSFADVDNWPSTDEWIADEGWVKITRVKELESQGDFLIDGKFGLVLSKVDDPERKVNVESGSFEDISCEYWDYQDLK